MSWQDSTSRNGREVKKLVRDALLQCIATRLFVQNVESGCQIHFWESARSAVTPYIHTTPLVLDVVGGWVLNRKNNRRLNPRRVLNSYEGRKNNRRLNPRRVLNSYEGRKNNRRLNPRRVLNSYEGRKNNRQHTHKAIIRRHGP